MTFRIAGLAPLLATCAVLLAPAAALADVQAGADAWARGDYASAVREWEASAAQNDAAALYNLGQAYRFGTGVPQDIGKAEEFFGEAAALGHVQAADNYAILRFQRGDHSGALPYLIESTARGNAPAQYVLGIANFEGDGVPQDWVRAYALLTLARQGGLPQAETVIAQMDARIPQYEREKGQELASQLGAEIDLKQARQRTGPAEKGAPVTLAGTLAVPAPAPPPSVEVTVPAPEPVPILPAVAVAPAVQVTTPVTAATAPPPSTAWRVQLGAFGVRANANSYWNTLKDRPEIAGRDRIDVGTGRVKRLLAGGFATEDEAKSACSRLAAAGFGCFIVRN